MAPNRASRPQARQVPVHQPHQPDTAQATAHAEDPTGALNGTVSDLDAVSNLTADRVHYSTTTLVPPALLGPANANMIYNLAFLKSDSPQPSGVGDERFPQGSGPGTATLTKTAASPSLLRCRIAPLSLQPLRFNQSTSATSSSP